MSAKPTIFIVDDDSAVLESLIFLIKSAGFSVQAFSSAKNFLESYQTNQLGCLLLDLNMPDMSGIELQLELLSRGIFLPIIFISAHAEISTKMQAMQNGAIDFLTKPIKTSVLFERIQTAIRTGMPGKAG